MSFWDRFRGRRRPSQAIEEARQHAIALSASLYEVEHLAQLYGRQEIIPLAGRVHDEVDAALRGLEALRDLERLEISDASLLLELDPSED